MQTFALRPFPRRLARSLLFFAGAGCVMAGAVWSDPAVSRAVPLVMAALACAVPALFAWQIRRHGFDPLASLALTDDGLLAIARDGTRRLVPWRDVRGLARVEAGRTRGRAVLTAEGPPLRWFGEVVDEEAFEAALAAKTGLAWEAPERLPG